MKKAIAGILFPRYSLLLDKLNWNAKWLNTVRLNSNVPKFSARVELHAFINRSVLRNGEEPVDYLAVGPIFATGSKQNPDPVVGLDRLRTLRALTQKPLVAIGGITRELAPKVFEAGADSVAVIGDLFPDVRARAKEWIAISAGARDAAR